MPALNTKVSSRSELELEKKREKIVSEAMKKLLAVGEKKIRRKVIQVGKFMPKSSIERRESRKSVNRNVI